jgi:hypothetical protein
MMLGNSRYRAAHYSSRVYSNIALIQHHPGASLYELSSAELQAASLGARAARPLPLVTARQCSSSLRVSAQSSESSQQRPPGRRGPGKMRLPARRPRKNALSESELVDAGPGARAASAAHITDSVSFSG